MLPPPMNPIPGLVASEEVVFASDVINIFYVASGMEILTQAVIGLDQKKSPKNP